MALNFLNVGQEQDKESDPFAPIQAPQLGSNLVESPFVSSPTVATPTVGLQLASLDPATSDSDFFANLNRRRAQLREERESEIDEDIWKDALLPEDTEDFWDDLTDFQELAEDSADFLNDYTGKNRAEALEEYLKEGTDYVLDDAVSASFAKWYVENGTGLAWDFLSPNKGIVEIFDVETGAEFISDYRTTSGSLAEITKTSGVDDAFFKEAESNIRDSVISGDIYTQDFVDTVAFYLEKGADIAASALLIKGSVDSLENFKDNPSFLTGTQATYLTAKTIAYVTGNSYASAVASFAGPLYAIAVADQLYQVYKAHDRDYVRSHGVVTWNDTDGFQFGGAYGHDKGDPTWGKYQATIAADTMNSLIDKYGLAVNTDAIEMAIAKYGNMMNNDEYIAQGSGNISRNMQNFIYGMFTSGAVMPTAYSDMSLFSSPENFAKKMASEFDRMNDKYARMVMNDFVRNGSSKAGTAVFQSEERRDLFFRDIHTTYKYDNSYSPTEGRYTSFRSSPDYVYQGVIDGLTIEQATIFSKGDITDNDGNFAGHGIYKEEYYSGHLPFQPSRGSQAPSRGAANPSVTVRDSSGRIIYQDNDIDFTYKGYFLNNEVADYSVYNPSSGSFGPNSKAKYADELRKKDPYLIQLAETYYGKTFDDPKDPYGSFPPSFYGQESGYDAFKRAVKYSGSFGPLQRNTKIPTLDEARAILSYGDYKQYIEDFYS